MERNNNDATLGNDGQQPPQTNGDSVQWSDIRLYQGRSPPGYSDEWTISTISWRFAHGERSDVIVESPTGENVTLGEPHWYVTLRCDRFPETAAVTAEFDSHVFGDIAALEAWFEDENMSR